MNTDLYIKQLEEKIEKVVNQNKELKQANETLIEENTKLKVNLEKSVLTKTENLDDELDRYNKDTYKEFKEKIKKQYFEDFYAKR